jgi:sphingomyelin phosphodiesterase D
MTAMFDRIAQQRRAGKNIGFVWLDIKNPDYCDSGDAKWRHCSVAALRDLARTKLGNTGVRVLYGFYGNAGGTGWKDVSHHLTDHEGVNTGGDAADVRRQFNRSGVPSAQRVMDEGLVNLSEPNVLGNVRKQTRLDARLRDQVKLARVFGWTTTAGERRATWQPGVSPSQSRPPGTSRSGAGAARGADVSRPVH